jgi:hypothetical protein
MLEKMIQRKPRVYFHVETLYYRFMDAFNKRMFYYRFMDAFKKRMFLFLLTLVACIILSMLI